MIKEVDSEELLDGNAENRLEWGKDWLFAEISSIRDVFVPILEVENT